MTKETTPSVTEQAELVERLKNEAQIHAQEARTANATIAEIYRIVTGGTGEPGNWHGAEPVRKCIDGMRSQIDALFGAIEHGDATHRAWLKEAIECHFAGHVVPEVRASQAASHSDPEPIQKWTDADGTKWEGVRGGPWKRTPASGPQCRDCADFGPICPNSGRRCDGAPLGAESKACASVEKVARNSLDVSAVMTQLAASPSAVAAFNRLMSASPAPSVGEPIYQVRNSFLSDPPNVWRDAEVFAYDVSPEEDRRIVFATPPEARAVTEGASTRSFTSYETNILNGVADWLDTRSHTTWAKDSYSGLMQSWAKDLRDILAAPAAAVPESPSAVELTSVLREAWAKAEPDHSITKHPESYVRTFYDMAAAVVAALNTPTQAPAASEPVPSCEHGCNGCENCIDDDRDADDATEAPSDEMQINGEPATAHSILAALVDIHDDEVGAPPEHRCYIPSAYSDTLDMARRFLAVGASVQPVQASLSDERPSIKWPKARDVGRLEDMSPDGVLRVGLDNDGDAYVSVWTERGGGVEFCTSGNGGGRSPRTREALLALMVAMEADNAQDPRRDWWAQRNLASSTPTKGGEASQ